LSPIPSTWVSHSLLPTLAHFRAARPFWFCEQ
jgi:hypothetical protein